MTQPIFKFAIREDLKDCGINFLPTKGEPYATGWDVRAALMHRENIVIKPGEYFKIPLGFRILLPEGWWIQLHPRSSSFTKKYMHNLIGIIDEHYSQEVLFAGQYCPTESAQPLIINFGEAIGQIIPIKRQDMSVQIISNDEYDDFCKHRNAVRSGGFGSTDKVKS